MLGSVFVFVADLSSVFLRGGSSSAASLVGEKVSASPCGDHQQLQLGVRLEISSRWIIRGFVSWIAFESAASGHSASVCGIRRWQQGVSVMAARSFGDGGD